MAKSSVPLRSSASIERELYGAPRERPERGDRRTRLEEAAVSDEPRNDAELLTALQSKIARTPGAGEGRNEFNERRQKILMDDYEAALGRAEGLRTAMIARLTAAPSITEAEYAGYIERPATFKEARSPQGEPPFRALAKDYDHERRFLQSRQAAYEEAVIDLGFVQSKEAVSGKRAKRGEHSLLERTQHELERVLQAVLIQRELTLEEGGRLHLLVAESLRKTNLPKEGEVLFPNEYRSFVLVQYLYVEIEKRLDRVRVRAKREVDVLAKQARMAGADAEGSKNELRRLLEQLAPLYSLGGASSVAEFVDSAERFKLDQAWFKRLTEWAGGARTEQRPVFEAERDALQPRLEAERTGVFPLGPTLAAAPLGAYAAESAE